MKVLGGKMLLKHGEKFSSGKRSKERTIIALCASMMSESINPLFIWKYGRPRCFKDLNINLLPVEY